MGGLDGDVAVVTGGSSGIGEGLARMLAGQGAAVALAARREVELRRVAEDLDRLLARVQEELGPVDVLVNAAGVAAYQPIHELDMALWDRQLRVNLRAPARLCAAVLPGMRERRRGLVVNVASEAGVFAYAGMGAYAVSKHGLCALTRLIAEENQELGVKAWAICPGMVDTPLVGDAGPARERFLKVADVVGVVETLLLQDDNVKMGPEILIRTMRNPWA
jgi:NAD(P)-dependent dehydrogenase (short-subunit alcohol dehydrogenase family)